MRVKYVGPKVDITKNGVSFDNNKEDKYVYLNIAIQLIKAIEHEYIPERTYTYDITSRRLSDDEINQHLMKNCEDYEEKLSHAKEKAEAYVTHEIERVSQNTLLAEEEKDAFMKNLEMMRSYMVQRNINKVAYYCVVEKLAELFKKEHIDYVIVPMFQKFAHVLHTAQGILINQKVPIDSNMEVIEKEGALFFKLDIINR